MAWHQISIVSDARLTDELSDFLTELGAVSVTYMNADSQPVYEPEIGETKIWQQTKTIALFELDYVVGDIEHLLFQQFSKNSVTQWHSEVLEDKVWERTWLEHYKPMKFGDNLWVYPSEQVQDNPDCVNLILDPGLAFGTGTHPTTALCLEWLATHDLRDKVVIDFGCGSGILAVAAALLGARQVHAIDIDPQALTATFDNALKNNVSTQIEMYFPEDFQDIKADVVLANILAKPLIELSSHISALLNSQGQLVLSGVLEEQSELVQAAYLDYFTMQVPVLKQEWCRLEGLKI